MSDTENRPFEIGLVMAGAVSAGAYTAGVTDFLMEALETWERKKRSGDVDAPPHLVKVKVITGASAGAITAAVLGSSVRSRDYPFHKPTPLYQTWVDLVNIDGLLATGDLEKNKPVLSLLNSEFLEGIADRVLAQEWDRADWPAYFSDPLELYFTVTNLRGVPYGVQFTTDGSDGDYVMRQHADYMHFFLSPRSDITDFPLSALPLGTDANRNRLDGNWRTLKASALASGAFPVGLAAQALERTGTWAYDLRYWPFPLEPSTDPDAPCICTEFRRIEPGWPPQLEQKDTFKYQFVNVDGGVANNEPFEIARCCLAGQGVRNPRDAREAHRCVLMIDPFPDATPFELGYKVDEQRTLLKVLPNLISAMISQLRFKTQELELALDKRVFSRWLVAPRRYETTGEVRHLANYPIACGGLSGFSGFFSRAFREHDYQLGRRNAQKFLLDTFVLDEENPVFAAWTDETSRKAHRIVRDGVGYLPVIPLLAECRQTEAEPVWPKGAMTEAHFGDLTERLMTRADRLVTSLATAAIASRWERMLVNVGWNVLKWRRRILGKTMVDPIVKTIREDLQKRGLA